MFNQNKNSKEESSNKSKVNFSFSESLRILNKDVLDFLRKIFSKLKFSVLKEKIYKALFANARKKNNQKAQSFFAHKLYSLHQVKDNVLTKYIAKELFLYFLVCFAFFFVVFFVNQILLLAETILRKRVPVGSVLKLILYALPAIIAQSAPFATLVGFLMCLGRMVTDNEILILRASGQKYLVLLKPILIMGILISIFSFIMNDYFLPLGTLKYNRMFRQIIVSNPAVEIESNSIKRMNDSTLVIGNVNKEHVNDIVFFDSQSNGEQRIIISKDTDIIKSTSRGILMQLKMQNSLVLMMNKNRKNNWDTLESDELQLNVFEDSIITSDGSVSPREMTSWDLGKRIRRLTNQPNFSKRQMNSYKLEYNKKFSIPFGSIFFAILAFPLALIFGRKDGQTLGLIFGIIISVLYWAANILGQMFGLRSGWNGFWVMWGPNFFIGLLGIILYLRLKRK